MSVRAVAKRPVGLIVMSGEFHLAGSFTVRIGKSAKT
jgi:hypothetical protein